MVVESRVLHREGGDAGEAHGALSRERVPLHEERCVTTSARKAPEASHGHIARHRPSVAATALVGMIPLAAGHAAAAATTSIAPAPASASHVRRTFSRDIRSGSCLFSPGDPVSYRRRPRCRIRGAEGLAPPSAAELGFAVRDAGPVTGIELAGPSGAPALGLVVHGDVEPVAEAEWSGRHAGER
jgi:hypothetical protein